MDGIHPDENWSSSSSIFFLSDGFTSSWASLTPQMRLSRARHSSCRRRASIKNAFRLHAFSHRSHAHHTNCLEFIPDLTALCCVLPFPYPFILSILGVSLAARNVQRPTKSHFRLLCVHYSVGWKRSNWASICLGARQFPPHLQVTYRLMTQPSAIPIP
jgi:hypothetical protein